MFQGLAHRSKIRLAAFDALANGQKGEGVFRIKGLEIEGRLDSGRVFAFGAGVQNKNIHVVSSHLQSS